DIDEVPDCVRSTERRILILEQAIQHVGNEKMFALASSEHIEHSQYHDAQTMLIHIRRGDLLGEQFAHRIRCDGVAHFILGDLSYACCHFIDATGGSEHTGSLCQPAIFHHCDCPQHIHGVRLARCSTKVVWITQAGKMHDRSSLPPPSTNLTNIL